MTAGYSGTPLAKKLSLKDGMSTWFHAMPASVRAEIRDISLNERDAPEAGLQAHISSRPSAMNSNAC
jgi:hypothetical protein